MKFDVAKIRDDFPLLQREIDHRPIVYLDSAATSLKPKAVVEAMLRYYYVSCANIHRGVHALSQEASDLYEEARAKVARFINANDHEIIFVRNATEAINLVAHCLPRQGDVLTTLMEHHSNLISWRGNHATHLAGLQPDGTLEMNSLAEQLNRNNIALTAVTHISNGLGVVNPVRDIISLAHQKNSLVLIDGSQSVPHQRMDVKELGCDFLTFSGHKMLGPSGIGVLYGREELLKEMPPFLLGGDMVSAVHQDSWQVADLPWKFEAGTPFVEGAIGLGAAVDYLSGIGMDSIHAQVRGLLAKAIGGLRSIEGVTVHGPESLTHRGSAVSFSLGRMEAHALAKMLSNRYNIMLRSGFHCAQPLHEALQLNQSARASFYLYNTVEEVETLVESIRTIARFYI
jgi:cysteine desulfurase / selenocysteine lyase